MKHQLFDITGLQQCPILTTFDCQKIWYKKYCTQPRNCLGIIISHYLYCFASDLRHILEEEETKRIKEEEMMCKWETGRGGGEEKEEESKGREENAWRKEGKKRENERREKNVPFPLILTFVLGVEWFCTFTFPFWNALQHTYTTLPQVIVSVWGSIGHRTDITSTQ